MMLGRGIRRGNTPWRVPCMHHACTMHALCMHRVMHHARAPWRRTMHHTGERHAARSWPARRRLRPDELPAARALGGQGVVGQRAIQPCAQHHAHAMRRALAHHGVCVRMPCIEYTMPPGGSTPSTGRSPPPSRPPPPAAHPPARARPRPPARRHGLLVLRKGLLVLRDRLEPPQARLPP